MQNIQLSKIATSPTDTTYALAYSTLNLYVVIGIKDFAASHESIGSLGKKLLEKLQREYFAQDEKNLETIKSSVTNSIVDIPSGLNYSLILGTVSSDILYIIIANKGKALIKRDGKIGTIAKGEEGNVTAFSGRLEHNDIVILESHGFEEKISPEVLRDSLKSQNATEIGETLLPKIHEDSTGSEAAIILQYAEPSPEPSITPDTLYEEEQSKKPTHPEKEMLNKEVNESENKSFPIENEEIPRKNNIDLLNNIRKLTGNKKAIIIIIIAILITTLIASLLWERNKEEERKSSSRLEKIITPAKKQLDEALAIMDLNKGIAIENLLNAKKTLTKSLDDFEKGTKQRKEIENLISLIDKKLEEVKVSNVVKNKKEIAGLESLGKLQSVTTKGGTVLIAGDKESVAQVQDGKGSILLEKIGVNPIQLTADENNIYMLSDKEILRINKKSKQKKSIIKIDENAVNDIDTFTNNIYLLNANENSIDKYTDPSFQKSSYLTGGAKLSKKPLSLTIDSSIWVTFDDGTLAKFIKGKQEDFTLKSMPAPLGKSTTVTTDVDFDKLYLFDKDNQKIIVTDKAGVYVNQYELASIGKAEEISIDEKGRKIYVITTSNKLFSFDL